MNTYFHPQPELFGLRVVKYIRCSHDGQVLHGDTLEAQDSLLDEFIKVNRMVLVDTFIDEALTARKKFTRRKEFVRLLDGVRAHSFDMILFTKLDRWFSNIGDNGRRSRSPTTPPPQTAVCTSTSVCPSRRMSAIVTVIESKTYSHTN